MVSGTNQVRHWLSAGLTFAFYAALAILIIYILILLPVRSYMDSRKSDQNRQEIEAATVRIRDDFDNYVRAGPLLKGNTARAFERVVDEKLQEHGFERTDRRLLGLEPAQRWRKANDLLAEEERKAMDLKRRADEDFSRCLSAFDAKRCEILIAGAYCLTDGCPTVEAAQMFDDAAFDAGYVRDDELCECL